MHPALAVVVGLTVALLLSKKQVPMGLAFVAGAVSILVSAARLQGAGPAFGALLTIDTWLFAAQVTLVFVMSIVMRLAGNLDVLVDAAGAIIRNRRVRLASLPALVGLLPMPGGAVVSAPLVDRTRCDVDLGAHEKNLINYWFRHIWEVSWPLYPPLLYVAATFVPGGDMARLVAGQVPLTLLLILGGWWFILRRVPGGDDPLGDQRPTAASLCHALAPLIIVIAAMQPCRLLLESTVSPERVGGAGLVGALVLGLLVAMGRRPALLLRALGEKKVWSLLVLALGVKLFGSVVNEVGAAVATAELVREAGLPPLLAMGFLPFFIGVVSGATIMVVTAAFPVVVALVPADGGSGPLLPYLVFAYAMGFIGYMLSPVHMCLVLSSKFFGQSVTDAYGRLSGPLCLFFVGSVGVFLALLALLA